MSDSGKGGIGTLSESSLHQKLKEIYSKPGDRVEAKIDGYIIDIVKNDVLVEIQTQNFGALRKKILALIPMHKMRLVHPIPVVRWIVRVSPEGVEISRRRSPKRGSIINVFEELVSIPTLINHSNFEIEVVEVFEEQILQDDGKGSWRRKGWSVIDRRLIDVAECHLFRNPSDLVKLLPPSLEVPFTTADLAQSLNCTKALARKITYCLWRMKAIRRNGKKGRSFLYSFS